MILAIQLSGKGETMEIVQGSVAGERDEQVEYSHIFMEVKTNLNNVMNTGHYAYIEAHRVYNTKSEP